MLLIVTYCDHKSLKGMLMKIDIFFTFFWQKAFISSELQKGRQKIGVDKERVPSQNQTGDVAVTWHVL